MSVTTLAAPLEPGSIALGTVDAAGATFLNVSSAQYGEEAPTYRYKIRQGASGSYTNTALTAVQGSITGLVEGTLYNVLREATSGAEVVQSNVLSFTTDVVTGGDGAGTAFGVVGLHIRVGDGDTDYIEAIAGADKSVALYWIDADGDRVPIASGATAALLDSAGAAAGTATITDYHLATGYLLVRLQIPSTGAKPSTLRISFGGGAGAADKYDIGLRVWG